MKSRGFVLRTLGVVMVLVLAMSTMGCQPKLTPKETLQKIQASAMAQKNYAAAFEGQMDMTFKGDVPPEAAPYMDMFKNIKYSGDMQFKDTDKLADMAMHYNVDLNGLSMKLEMYFDGDQMIVKYPVMPQYIVVDFKEVLDKATESADMPVKVDYASLIADLETLSNTWLPGFSTKVLEGADEKSMELIESYEFTLNGVKSKSKAIKVTLTAEAVMNMFNAAIAQTKDSKELYTVLKKYDTTGAIGTFEEYQALITEGNSALELDELKKAMENVQYAYIIGYDRKYMPTTIAMDMKMAIKDEASAMDVAVNMTGVYQMNYKEVAVVIPEITPENSLSLVDMMGGLLNPYETSSGATASQDASTATEEVPINFYLDAQIYKVEEVSQAIAQLPDMSTIDSLLETSALDERMRIVNVFFATADGKMYLYPKQELPADYDARLRPWFTKALESNTNIEELYQDVAGQDVAGRYLQTISQKVVVNGAVIGVVGIDFAVE